MRALVSAADAVAVARAQADRVHDAVRRLGCTPVEAVEVVEESGVQLLEELRSRPEVVTDLVGRWLADARRLAERVRTHTALADIRADETQGLLRDDAVDEALNGLSEQARLALLVRDSYDLPLSALGAALGTDSTHAAQVVGRARLDLMAAATGEEVPTLAGHPIDGGSLAQFADGAAEPAPSQRKHMTSCATCAGVLDLHTRARGLLAGLAVLAIPDAERHRVLQRIATRANATLPSVEQVSHDLDADEPGPLVSPLLIALTLAIALVGGVLVGASRSSGSAGGPSDADLLPTPTASVTATGSRSATPSVTATATTSATATSSATAPPPTSATSTRPPSGGAPQGPLTMTLSPTSGPNETTVTVRGSGWHPGYTVDIAFHSALNSSTTSSSQVVVDARGRFTGQVVAHEPQLLLGRHTVTVTDGEYSDEATFTMTAS